MRILRFKRFTKTRVLRRIGRPLLSAFLDRFAAQLQSKGVSLPAPELLEEQYYDALGALFLAPEALPDDLNEALFAIDELATADGQQRLERALSASPVRIGLLPDSTPEELALQVWLEAPELLAATHNQQRMSRLTAFEHFGTGLPPGERGEFIPPAQAGLEQLASELDKWFSRHHRGELSTRVELYPIEEEYWFLVRHGNTYIRTPKIERQKTEVLHFRPEQDDVVVYDPEHDELRINARTRGERELYREQLGLLLRGSENYFSERRTYTLEPLRIDGAEALTAEGIEGLTKVTLREVEVASENGFNDVTTLSADDLFQSAAAKRQPQEFIPTAGRIRRATFDFHFAGCQRPRLVQVRLPNVLKVGRHCDVRAIDRFLCRAGYRRRAETARPSCSCGL